MKTKSNYALIYIFGKVIKKKYDSINDAKWDYPEANLLELFDSYNVKIASTTGFCGAENMPKY